MSERPKILLVDDEDFIREVGAVMLGVLGYDAITAASGGEGLEVYESLQPGIELVLVDLSMPDMDGGTCFRELRQIDPGVRVLMVTGHARNATIDRLVEEGMLGMLQKPFTLNSLRDAVAPALATS